MKKCPYCGELVGDNAATCFKCHLDFSNVEASMKEIQEKRNAEAQKRNEARIAQEIEQKRREKEFEEMLLTSANSLEGYTIVEQHGLVFGETLFRSNVIDNVKLTMEEINQYDYLSDAESIKAESLTAKARNYAIEKMKRHAQSKSANAIIAIDMGITHGYNGIIHVSIYGTAVRIVKTE